MEKSEILNLETRRLIYNYIQDNPGLHLRELSRKLHMEYNNLRYHIQYLERHYLIAVKSKNSYLRVYAKDKIGVNDKELFNIIRQETPRYILLYFCYTPVCSQKELSENLEKHPTTIEYHLKKLVDMNIIEPAKVADGYSYTNLSDGTKTLRAPTINETLYRLKDPFPVIKLFWIYRRSFYKDKIFRVAFNQYVDDHRSIIKHKKQWTVKGFEFYVDLYIKTIYDIFPHPYHV